MNYLTDIADWLTELWRGYYSPWVVYQLVIIVFCHVLARLVARAVEPGLETRLRKIREKPRLMRFLVLLLRNCHWILFTLLMLVGIYVLQQFPRTGPGHVIEIAARLSLAWLLITIFSGVIRNRSLSKLATAAGWVFAAILILGQLENITHTLDSLAFSIGDFRLSALKIVNGIFLVVGLLWLASNTGRFLDSQIDKIEDLTPSVRVLTGKIVKIVLITAALLVALSSIGIDLTALTIFSGAVGLGIGFGLQKVVSNFISGIIILLDKSIKPGDTITLGETFGWIRELRARFVSVITRDGKEYLIPNEDLITHQVVNWSFSDNMIRVDVPFGVAYNSDPHQVTELAIGAARGVERISDTPAPVCWMTEFGDSSLNFLLRFWIGDPQNGMTNIRGKVLLALWDTFKEHGISIPYPHREIIIHSRNDPDKAVTRGYGDER